MRTMNAVVGVTLSVLAGPLSGQVHAHDHTSPYAGYVDREIKALSAEEVEGLRAGEGLGFAMAAELNGIPGPRHVLDMAPMLGLSRDQTTAIQAVFDEMQAEARSLGAEVVELERTLDASFAAGDLTEDRLAEMVAAIAERRGRLREVHLRAHLRTAPLLTGAQREHYRMARGYGG